MTDFQKYGFTETFLYTVMLFTLPIILFVDLNEFKGFVSFAKQELDYSTYNICEVILYMQFLLDDLLEFIYIILHDVILH